MAKTKPKVAFFDFTSCEGCQLTVIDALQTQLDLLDAVEIAQFREAMSEMSQDYQIAFIEGACSRQEDEPRLRGIRERAQVVIALGACAHLGGVNTLRNWHSQDKVQEIVYGQMGKIYAASQAQPIDAVIPIDGFIPGCPIDRQEFVRFVRTLLQNRQPQIPDYPVCVECRLKENGCVLLQGKACLGSVTRAGCGAICPTFGSGCDGCRGLISTPNISGLKLAFNEHGLDETSLLEKIKLFQSYQVNGIMSSKVA
jgi:sulfhydrogenase subunit delta